MGLVQCVAVLAWAVAVAAPGPEVRAMEPWWPWVRDGLWPVLALCVMGGFTGAMYRGAVRDLKAGHEFERETLLKLVASCQKSVDNCAAVMCTLKDNCAAVQRDLAARRN